jgi:hypothetical protein
MGWRPDTETWKRRMGETGSGSIRPFADSIFINSSAL